MSKFDIFDFNPEIELEFADEQKMNFKVSAVSKEFVLKNADFITLHVPAIDGKAVIGAEELAMMKKGAAIVNCARGGVIDEQALITALDNGHLSFAGLDVFENEPTPSPEILSHAKISLSPHIGAATNEAQERIGVELAHRIIEELKK
jgi:D-3-phosphoglycerate dehydrogenase